VEEDEREEREGKMITRLIPSRRFERGSSKSVSKSPPPDHGSRRGRVDTVQGAESFVSLVAVEWAASAGRENPSFSENFLENLKGPGFLTEGKSKRMEGLKDCFWQEMHGGKDKKPLHQRTKKFCTRIVKRHPTLTRWKF